MVGLSHNKYRLMLIVVIDMRESSQFIKSLGLPLDELVERSLRST
jgi:hypothetical protein